MEILLVTYDIKPVKIGSAIAAIMAMSGIDITVCAAGPSLKVWRDAGFEVSDPSEVKVADFYLVVSGLSSPQGAGFALEEPLRTKAVLEGVKLAYLVDDWGAEGRTNITPSLYLVIDEFGRDLARKHCPDAQVIVMGDDAVGVTPPKDLADTFHRIRRSGRQVALLYGNKDPRSRDAVTLAIESMRQSPEWVLIPSMHPGASPEFNDWYKGRVSALEAECPGSTLSLPGKADDMAALADIVIGIGGTGVRAACNAGRVPALAWSPGIGEILNAESGEPHHILVRNNVALELKEPINLSELVKSDHEFFGRRESFFAESTPFSAEKTAEKILAWLAS